jgi:uncharacterized protein with FMN-binding domain
VLNKRRESHMRKRRGIRLSAACAAAVVLLGGCAFVDKINKLVVDNVAVSQVRDGTYDGSESILPVSADVRVTVNGGRITDITMLSHSHGPNHGADAILPRVIAAQSLDVDAISGATYSSKVVRKAIEIALKKGL